MATMTGKKPPKRPPPPLTHVRSFEVAARHQSFTRAARELGLTQAAISTHVRALEQYVGRPLFTRHARSLTLTEAGEAYLPTLRQALTQIDSATDAIAKSAREQSVVVACPTSLAQLWLPRALARFRIRHPEVEVLVHATVWERAMDDIADVTLSTNREDAVPAGAVPLWPEALMLVCAPDIARRMHSPDDIAALPHITVSGRQELLPIMAKALGAARLNPPCVLRSNGSNVALEMAANGMGTTVALASLGRIYLARGLVAEPFGVRPPSPWGYALHPLGPRHSQAAAAMVQAIRDEARAFDEARASDKPRAIDEGPVLNAARVSRAPARAQAGARAGAQG